MAKCARCGTSDTFLFTCDGCGLSFCSDHQPPENHNCPFEPEPSQAHQVEETSEPSNAAKPSPGDGASNGDAKTGFAPTIGRQLPSVRITLAGIVVIGIVFAVYFLAFNSGLFAAADPPNAGSPVQLNETLTEHLIRGNLNERRSALGYPPISADRTLTQIAQYHSDDMAARNYTAHQSPDGETMRDRFDKFNYSCQSGGELLLFTFYNRPVQTGSTSVVYQNESQLADGIVSVWWQSEAHRETIVNESWDELGVGLSMSKNNKVFVTANLCNGPG